MKITSFFKIVVYLSFFISSGCNFQSSKVKEVNKEYNEMKSYFDHKYLDHFPKKIMPSESFIRFSQDISFSHPFLWLKVKHSSDTLHEIVDTNRLKAKAIYDANDTCLLIIDRHLNEENIHRYDKKLRYGPDLSIPEKPCHEKKLPVPKFWGEKWNETKKTEIGLKPEYKLYILDAKNGIYMDQEKLPNGKYTPENWKHGYSRGIAINESNGTIIYWFDIW